MHIWVAIDFTSRGLQDTCPGSLCKAEHIDCAMHTGLKSLLKTVLVALLGLTQTACLVISAAGTVVGIALGALGCQSPGSKRAASSTSYGDTGVRGWNRWGVGNRAGKGFNKKRRGMPSPKWQGGSVIVQTMHGKKPAHFASVTM